MKLTFFGAAHGVTGSSSLLEAGSLRVLVDCGMFQGSSEIESRNSILGFDPKNVTHVLVTHAHLDHVGRLPLLIKQGYEGHIYANPATIELAKLIMEDALEVMQYDSFKFGRPPLYSAEDIAVTLDRCKPVEYETVCELEKEGDSAKVVFHDAGHIFGSAFIEMRLENKTIVFSGDVGNTNVPILKDTAALPITPDVVVCESTYGDRLHEATAGRDGVVEKMIRESLRPGGVVLIPSFSLERTQELIYELNELIDHQHRLPKIPIFLDSPLAIDAFKVYRRYPHYYDAEAEKYVNDGDDLFAFPGFTMTYTRDDSKRINQVPGTKIIIAGSGMMNGGRILHHALRYLSDEKSTLLLIGYQSPGTLGRQLYDGAKVVKIFDEKVFVRCHVKMVGSLSAHADQAKLVGWLTAGQTKKVFLNHGEFASAAALQRELRKHSVVAEIAAPGLVYEL